MAFEKETKVLNLLQEEKELREQIVKSYGENLSLQDKLDILLHKKAITYLNAQIERATAYIVEGIKHNEKTNK